MKQRITEALGLVNELIAAQRITPDGAQVAQQLQVTLQQAESEAETPPEVKPLDEQLAHLTERVNALCDAAGV